MKNAAASLLLVLAACTLASTASGAMCPGSPEAPVDSTIVALTGSRTVGSHAMTFSATGDFWFFCPVANHCIDGGMVFKTSVVPRVNGTAIKTVNITWEYRSPGAYPNIIVSPGDKIVFNWTGTVAHALKTLTLPAPVAAKPMLFKATCLGTNENPKVTTKTKASVVLRVYNASVAIGSWTIISARQVYVGHIHKGNATTNGPVAVFGFNSTLNGVRQPLTGSFSGNFTFNPSVSLVAGGGNVTDDLIKGVAYFNFHTVAYPAGEVRGQFKKA